MFQEYSDIQEDEKGFENKPIKCKIFFLGLTVVAFCVVSLIIFRVVSLSHKTKDSDEIKGEKAVWDYTDDKSQDHEETKGEEAFEDFSDDDHSSDDESKGHSSFDELDQKEEEVVINVTSYFHSPVVLSLESNDTLTAMIKKFDGVVVKYFNNPTLDFDVIYLQLGYEFSFDEEVRICEVNCSIHRDICAMNGAFKLPAVQVYTHGKGELYEGPLTVEDMKEFIINHINAIPVENTNQIVSFRSAEDFKAAQKIYPAIFIKYFDPYCPYCTKMVPAYERLGVEYAMNDTVLIAETDCTRHMPFCNAQSVRAFPTMKLYLSNRVLEYRGTRETEDMKNFIEGHWKTQQSRDAAEKREEKQRWEDEQKHKREEEKAQEREEEARRKKEHERRKQEEREQQQQEREQQPQQQQQEQQETQGWEEKEKEEEGSRSRKEEEMKRKEEKREEKVRSVVMNLTADTFDVVIAANKMVVVNFFSPRCPRCIHYAPVYEQFGKAVAGNSSVVVAEVDCVQHGNLCTKESVTSYSTVKLYYKGHVHFYTNQPTADELVDLVKWVFVYY